MSRRKKNQEHFDPSFVTESVSDSKILVLWFSIAFVSKDLQDLALEDSFDAGLLVWDNGTSSYWMIMITFDNSEKPMQISPLYTSAISLRRRIVDRVAAAAGVLEHTDLSVCDRDSFEDTLCEGILCPALHLRDSICTSCDGLSTSLAVPDTGWVSLDRVLSAECAGVFGVLSDFHLLHLFSQTSTICIKFISWVRSLIFWCDLSCAELAGNTDLLGTLRHGVCRMVSWTWGEEVLLKGYSWFEDRSTAYCETAPPSKVCQDLF